MTKWKKDETEFTVRINYNPIRGNLAYIPKPVTDFLDNPTALKFRIKNGKVIVVESTD